MEQFKKFLATMAGRVTVTIVVAVIMFGAMVIAAQLGFFPLVIVVFAVCTYFGWKAINFITPSFFLILPLAGWLLYFLIKGVISFFVGYFVAPFQIGAMVSKSVQQKVQN